MFISGCQPSRSYVALGDSFTSGPLITPQDRAVPGCLRSDVNYPSLVAPDLGLPAFRDVSCSGAQTKDMTQAQDVDPDPDNPPQLDGLDRAPTVVTLGIGGNDIGFTSIATKCGELGLQDPTGSPCKQFYNRTGSDEIAARIAALAPKLRTVLDRIDARAPRKVFVVGYPALAARDGRRLRAVPADAPRRQGRRLVPARRRREAAQQHDPQCRGGSRRGVRRHLHAEHRPRRLQASDRPLGRAA